MAEVSFGGTVNGGRLIPDSVSAFTHLPPRMEGKRVRVIIKVRTSGATANQHGYYRSTVLPTFAEFCGYDSRVSDELETVHTALKRKYFGTEEKNGLEFVRSHADVDVEEMSGFLDWVLRLAAELGCYIPSSEEA